MKAHEHRHVAVENNIRIDGASMVTSQGHKHICGCSKKHMRR